MPHLAAMAAVPGGGVQGREQGDVATDVKEPFPKDEIA